MNLLTNSAWQFCHVNEPSMLRLKLELHKMRSKASRPSKAKGGSRPGGPEIDTIEALSSVHAWRRKVARIGVVVFEDQ